MRNRSPIWLMLAVIAFQGMGLVHALHLSVSHSHRCGCTRGGACEHEHPQSHLDRLSLHRQDHLHGDQDSPDICPVCQTLAALKAATDGNPDVPCFGLLPGLAAASAESFPLTQIAPSTLGPRAPPAST